MKKSRFIIVTRTATELAQQLGLTPADGAEIELRSSLNPKIIAAVRRKALKSRSARTLSLEGLRQNGRPLDKPQHHPSSRLPYLR
jgi:hypothetical protein